MSRIGQGRGRSSGLTMIEVLIAMAVLVVVFMITSSGIVGALRTQRVQEDATNSQAKMRRVVEVLSQELRGSVLGGITNYPLDSDSNTISFSLLSGGGGVLAESPPGGSWGTSEETDVYASDAGAAAALVGGPAVMVNRDGRALIIPEITSAPSGNKLQHVGCKISIPYTPGTRIFAVRALSFSFEPETGVLHQVEFAGGGGAAADPFAFNLTDFEIGYQYESSSDVQTRTVPWSGADGAPLTVYYDGSGTRYDLARLQLTVATEAPSGGGVREYVSYVELAGMGNGQRIEQLDTCDGTGLPDVDDPGEGEPDDPPPGGGEPGDDDGEGGDEGGGGGPGSGGPGGGDGPPWK